MEKGKGVREGTGLKGKEGGTPGKDEGKSVGVKGAESTLEKL